MAMSPRLLRPRASGSFDPRRIASLVNWFDAADESTVTLNGTTVSSWANKSTGPAVTQGTAGSQPTYTTAGVNGRNVLTFDGGDLMTATASYTITTGTMFVVVRENSGVDFSGIFNLRPASGNDQTNTDALFFDFSSSTSLARVNRGTQAASKTGSGLLGLGVVTGFVTGTSIGIRVDGESTSKNTVSATTGTSSGIIIGGRFQSGSVSNSFRANMTLCEVLHYTAALSVSEMSSVERYLGRKWGVAVA